MLANSQADYMIECDKTEIINHYQGLKNQDMDDGV
jgi:hypothetical protein